MKFQVDRKELVAVLNAAKSFCAKKLREGIPNALLLCAEGAKLRITATDLETTYAHLIPAEVEQEGSVIVDGKKISSLVKKLRRETVLFDLKEQLLDIRCGRASLDLETMPGEEYPATPSLGTGPLVNAAPLRDALLVTLPAASTDEARPVLSSILLGDEGSLVSTDGHRLHISPGESSVEKMLISRNGAANLAKLLEKEDKVLLLKEGQHLSVGTGDWRIFLRLVEGRSYPDWRRVVPGGNDLQFTVPRSEMLEVLALCKLVSGDVYLYFEGESLRIVSKEGSNSASESLACEGSETVSIKANASYLEDALNASQGGSVVFSLKDQNSPIRIDDEESGAYFVVMPMVFD